MIAALLVPVLVTAAPAAPVQGDRVGAYDPATAGWSLEGVSAFLYGNPGDHPFMGDWDCDGVDTPGLHRAEGTAAGPAGKVYLRNSNTTGIADVEYFFGDPGDVAFAGDFNGDGCDSVGLYRPSTGQVFLTNLLGSRNRGIGAAQVAYDFPAQGQDISAARAIAADFDGDGIDTVALHLPSTATVLGVRAAPMTFGDPGDQLVAGAWNGGSVETVAVYRTTTERFHLSDTNDGGAATASRSLSAGNDSIGLAWSSSPQPRSSHFPSADANDYAIIASNSAKVKRNAVIDGSAAVNTASAGTTLDPGFEFGLDQAATVNGDVAADDLLLNRNSTVTGDGFYQSTAVLRSGATVGGPFQVAGLLPVVTPPPFQTGTPGAAPVVVAAGTEVSLAPGAYGAVTVGGTLVLQGGTYDVASVSPIGGGGGCAFPCRSIVAEAPSVVRVAGRFDVGQKALVGTTVDDMVSPWDIAFHVNGTNFDPTNPNSLPPAATVGKGSKLDAILHAPNGTVLIDRDATGAGQAIGRDVLVDTGVRFRLPPRANDVAASVPEDGPPVTANFDASTSDGTAVDYFIVDEPAEGTVVNNGDGSFEFDPAGAFEDLNDGQTEDVTFTYRAKDPAGVASNTATVTITVKGKNDGVTAVDDLYDANEDTVLVVAAPGVLGNDDDPDSSATAVPIVNGQTSAGGGVNLAADGSFTFDPSGKFESLAAGESVDGTFVYTAQDASTSDTATVTITIEGRNDAPEAHNQAIDNTSVSFTITMTGSDIDASDDLEFSIATPPGEGTLGPVTNSNGTCSPQPCAAIDKNSATVVYTRPVDGAVFTTFTFLVDDLNGGTAAGTVTINPNLDPNPEPPDDPPGVEGVDARDKTVETETDKPVKIVLKAASDAAGDLAFSIHSGPTGGTLSGITPIDPDGAGPLPVRSAEVTYTPPAAQTGAFTFDFKAEEAGNPANFDTATVTVDVSDPAAPVDPVNPTVEDLTKTLEENETITFSLDESVVQSGVEDVCNQPPFPCGRAAQTDLVDDDTTDPAGDAAVGEPDLASVRVGVTAALDNVAFEVLYGSGFVTSTTRTGIVLDLDNNPATGFPGVDAANNDDDKLGIEYLINIGGDLGSTAVIRKFVSLPNNFTTVATVPATILADGHYVSLDLALLGDDDGEFTYKVTTQRFLDPGYTGIQDYMPDLGLNGGFVGVGDIVPSGSLRYTVLTLPSSGTLLDIEDDPVVVGEQLPTPIVKYVAGAGAGTFTASFAAENTALLSTVADLAFEVVVVGTCESNEDLCDDGRSP